MKFLILSFLTLLSFKAISEPTYLADQKLVTNQALDSAIMRLEEDRSCINTAESIEGLNACNKTLNNDMAKFKAKTMETEKEIKKPSML